MKHGMKAHRAAHGADPGTPHERLNRLHAMPGRPEGAMHGGDSAGAPGPAPGMGPATGPEPMPPASAMGGMGAPPMGAPPMGAMDDEQGEQT